MCDNKFARFNGTGLDKYTCWEVQEKYNEWIQQYKIINRVEKFGRPGSLILERFEEYKGKMDEFLDMCKHKNLSKKDQMQEKEKYEFEQSMKSPFFNRGLLEHYTPEDATTKTLYQALKDKGVI